MPPLRPLPDLVFIAVFKQLTPNSQLTASRMSNRCYLLVRAANRRVKLLNISDDSEFAINPFDLSYEFNDSDQFGVFSGPPVTPFTKWKHLKLSDTKKFDISTVERIVTIFSSVTSLTFATTYNDHSEELIALLQQAQWATQLTSCVLSPAVRKSEQVMHSLTAAINALPALQHLAYDWWIRRVVMVEEPVEMPELTILSQLKTIAFHTMPNSVLSSFERSINRHAAGNADLQVYLLSWRKQRIFGDLQTFSESFRSRIVRFRELICLFADVPRLCNQFPRLTALPVYGIKPDQVRALFSALSGFRQLTSLMLDVQFNSPREEDEEPDTLPARPVDQLHSVQGFNILAPSASHGHLQWLNLGWTLPHLQTLIVHGFYCSSCKISLSSSFRQDAPAAEFSQALGCLRKSILKVHSGVHPSRIFIETDLNKYRSAEELLLLATDAGQ